VADPCWRRLAGPHVVLLRIFSDQLCVAYVAAVCLSSALDQPVCLDCAGRVSSPIRSLSESRDLP